MPKINTTLTLNNGSVSSYKTGERPSLGVRDAIMVCMDRSRAVEFPFGVVRADLEGAVWSACERANALPSIDAILSAAASDVMAGHKPLVFIDVNAGAIENARLVFSPSEQAAEMSKAEARHMEVPPLLPYQLGAQTDGARVLLFKAEGEKGLRVHSIHPTHADAVLAECQFKDEHEVTTAILPMQTPISRVLADVAAGKTFAPVDAKRDVTTFSQPGLSGSPIRPSLASPSPFTEA